jgi:hypothetical protein
MLQALVDRSKSEVTKKSYALKVKKALEITGNTTPERMLKSHAASMSKLRAHYTKHSTLKQTLTVIVSMISANPAWRDKNPKVSTLWLKAHGEASRVLALDRKFTRYEDVRHKFVCMDEIVKMKKRLKKGAHDGDLIDSMTYLLLVLCVDVPPKRADFNDLKIVRKDVLKGNYLIVHDGNRLELVMHEYKTCRDVAYREVLPKQASRDIMASLDAFPRAYLFSGNDGGPMTPSAYSQFVIRRFKHLFGKGVGLSSLRHIYISDLYLNSATKAEKVAAAASMQHSIDMQKTYVVRHADGRDVCVKGSA